MEALQNYIKPELLILVPVLYILGTAVKKSEFKDKFIPWIIGIAGIILSCMYIGGSERVTIIGLFTAITQGILCAGASVFVNQLSKQERKAE